MIILEKVWQFMKKLNICLIYDSANSLLGPPQYTVGLWVGSEREHPQSWQSLLTWDSRGLLSPSSILPQDRCAEPCWLLWLGHQA